MLSRTADGKLFYAAGILEAKFCCQVDVCTPYNWAHPSIEIE